MSLNFEGNGKSIAFIYDDNNKLYPTSKSLIEEFKSKKLDTKTLQSGQKIMATSTDTKDLSGGFFGQFDMNEIDL